MKITANILGIIAVALFVLSYQLKKRQSIILVNAVSRVLYVLQYILLGAYEGALLDVVALLVSVLYRSRDRGFMKKHPTATVISTNAAIFALGMLTYKNIFSLLPILGVIFETLGLWLKKEKHIRIVSLLGAPFWLVYNTLSEAYGSSVGNVITLISIAIAIIRYDIMKKERYDIMEKEKKQFIFTVDDNIRFLYELTEGEYKSIFEHPYMATYKRLHEKYSLKVQLNLFYKYGDFTLEHMSERFRDEWQENSDWLKLSFHSKESNYRPYEFSGYDEVFTDCALVNREIVRFAGEKSLAKTTTVHYCRTTDEGIRALSDNGVLGLLGLFGTDSEKRTSYGIDEENAAKLRHGGIHTEKNMTFSAIDLIINNFVHDELCDLLSRLSHNVIKVMVHEPYFYPDYKKYHPDFEKKLDTVFDFLEKKGHTSIFFEELIK